MLRLVQQFTEADGQQQRGILDHNDQLVDDRRHGDRSGLRHDHARHGLMMVEAKRTCALHLTRVNGLHGATHDFRQICAGIERQRQRARNPNVHAVPDQLRHTKIEEERPHQNRRTAKHCDVNLGYAFQNLVFGHLHQAKSDTQYQRDRKRQQGDQQRVLQTGQQSRHRLFDKSKETDFFLSRTIGAIIGDLAGNRLDLFLRAGFAQILRDDRLVFA